MSVCIGDQRRQFDWCNKTLGKTRQTFLRRLSSEYFHDNVDAPSPAFLQI